MIAHGDRGRDELAVDVRLDIRGSEVDAVGLFQVLHLNRSKGKRIVFSFLTRMTSLSLWTPPLARRHRIFIPDLNLALLMHVQEALAKDFHVGRGLFGDGRLEARDVDPFWKASQAAR